MVFRLNKSHMLLIVALFTDSALGHASQKNSTEENYIRGLPINNSMTLNITNQEEIRLWNSTNDTVMGGESSGGLTFNGSYGVFSGVISRRNNGGFSSVTRRIKTLAGEYSIVALTVLGDGQSYQFRTFSSLNGYRIAYKHSFSTTKGDIKTISMPLKDFVATFRGRLIKGAPPIDSMVIDELGILFSSKEEVNFNLTLLRIDFL